MNGTDSIKENNCLLMNPDTLFTIANTLVLPGWLLLIVAPRWKYSFQISFYLIVVVLAVLYSSLLLPSIGSMPVDSFSTLDGLSALFSDKKALLAGWVHYLAFDLMIGMGITHDANKYHVKRVFVIPCLVFTFMSGPFGLLLYFIVRILSLRKIELVKQ